MRGTTEEAISERIPLGFRRFWDRGSRWLYAGEGIILAAVAVILLLAGLVIVLDAGRNLLAAISARPIAETVFAIAESALLALILAELVHSLMVTLDGGSLAPELLLVIAIIAILRKMLLTTVLVQPSSGNTQLLTAPMGELAALSLIILVLSVALAITRRHRSSTGSSLIHAPTR